MLAGPCENCQQGPGSEDTSVTKGYVAIFSFPSVPDLSFNEFWDVAAMLHASLSLEPCPTQGKAVANVPDGFQQTQEHASKRLH